MVRVRLDVGFILMSLQIRTKKGIIRPNRKFSKLCEKKQINRLKLTPYIYNSILRTITFRRLE